MRPGLDIRNCIREPLVIDGGGEVFCTIDTARRYIDVHPPWEQVGWEGSPFYEAVRSLKKQGYGTNLR
jgi:hypothetical protein